MKPIADILEDAASVDARIAQRWPREWARANDSSRPGRSKARNKLRKQYRDAVEREEWRERNPRAACSTCEHCGYFPQTTTRTCDLASDFHGYALTKPDDWCIRWSPLRQAATLARGDTA